MARVTHFEIHAEDPARAMRFYGNLFGWEFTSWPGPEPYWLVKTGEEGSRGIDGGLVLRRGPAPEHGQAVNAFICTLEVEALEPILAQLDAAGGSLALPTMPIPGVGWLAYAKDTEGNLFGLMQVDPSAGTS